ncbi:hypothetical protein [Devosia sp.]|uniref:hypothetical protein n=1 Tax=Devosia sp. TaxID=1871048 RepID=UPI003F6FC1CA
MTKKITTVASRVDEELKLAVDQMSEAGNMTRSDVLRASLEYARMVGIQAVKDELLKREH